MAAASLLFRFTADASGLKSGVSAAASELDKLQAAATGAGGKLIAALPPSLATAARGIGSSVTGLAGAFGGLSGVIAGLGVGKIVSDFLHTTGSLSDLSAQTDITIRDLQRFQFAGDLVGVSLDQISGAVGQLQNRLGSGDKSAFKALDDLGVTMRELQRLDPGQQFETIASAISRVPDPTKRAAIAMDLFGRAGIQLMPLLRSDMKAVGDQAFVMSDATVQAGDSFGDLITKIVNFGKVSVATVVLGPIVRGVEQIGLALQDAGRWVDVLRQKMDTLPKLPPSIPLAGNGGAPALTMSMAEADKAAEEITRKLAKAHEESARRAREAAIAYRELTTAAEELVGRGIDRQIAAERELWGQSVQAGLIATLRESRSEMLLMPPVADRWAQANVATTRTLLDMVSAGRTVPPVTEAQIRGFLTVNEKTVTWRESLTSLAQSMTNLAQTTGTKFIGSLASMTNAFDVGFKSVDSLKGGFDAMTSGKGLSSILSGFTGMVGGIGGLVSAAQAAIQIGKTLFSIFDRDKGRDLVEDFVKQFGGFEGIQKIFAGMGDEGHRLWVMLTQGVGRNNPDQARRAIEEVEAALKGLSKTVSEDVDAVLDGFEGRGITIPVHFDVDDLNLPSGSVTALGSGGLVRSPTLALIGESGPEAVVPLGQIGSFSGGDSGTLSEIQGMRADLKRLPDVLFRAIRDAYQTA